MADTLGNSAEAPTSQLSATGDNVHSTAIPEDPVAQRNPPSGTFFWNQQESTAFVGYRSQWFQVLVHATIRRATPSILMAKKFPRMHEYDLFILTKQPISTPICCDAIIQHQYPSLKEIERDHIQRVSFAIIGELQNILGHSSGDGGLYHSTEFRNMINLLGSSEIDCSTSKIPGILASSAFNPGQR
ncbi:hypothetical protein IW261DRAFT_1599146 [Armillaria novae-zelandiae]|uniref:Uncharacterized protein n=1 Tax=Armillaria novae-zelandiae TaxID=153914 RepID=A0AA39NBX2_9AGAR|nr:hypothetical protein IW261DRAFT_1599146 [Armillaria novae-zelandiae]